MLSRLFLISIFFIILSSPVHAVDCTHLNPNQSVSSEIETRLKGTASTFFRLGKIDGNIENTVNNEVKNIYDNYPNADQIVIQSRLIYLYCTLLEDAEDVSTKEKMEMVNTFYDKIFSVGKDSSSGADDEQKEYFLENDRFKLSLISFVRLGSKYTLRFRITNNTNEVIKIRLGEDKNITLSDDKNNEYELIEKNLKDTTELAPGSPRFYTVRFFRQGVAGNKFTYAAKHHTYGKGGGNRKQYFTVLEDVEVTN